MKPLVIINRGGGSAGKDSAQKVRAALASAGVEADIVEVEGGESVERAKQAVANGRPLVIAAGGDGTMSAVAGALAGTETPMGVLALGTLNHFAKDLGIPLDLDDACRLLASGKAMPVDVAELNGRVFINNSAVGLYPVMVLDREAQERKLGRSKWPAMLVATVRALVRFRHHRLTLSVDDASKTLDTPLMFVGNNDYRLDLAAAGGRESISEGRLCVVVLKPRGRIGLFAALARGLMGRQRSEDMLVLDDVQRIKVSSSRSQLAVSLDGEVCHFAPPLDYRIRPKALRVIAP